MQIQANLINNRMEHSFCIQFHNFFLYKISQKIEASVVLKNLYSMHVIVPSQC